MPFCEKCGNEVNEDDIYCSNCNASIKPTQIRRVTRRKEKNEKNEKSEVDEKNQNTPTNRLHSGLFLIWLGVSFVLRQMGYISSGNWWNVFLIGLGVLLAFRGYMIYSQMNRWGPAQGYIIGGVVVSFIGLSEFLNIGNLWPYLIILAGAFVIYKAYNEREKNPIP
ncbi:hypothetical protein ACFL0D_09350 [Thermoproteota archaeon]